MGKRRNVKTGFRNGETEKRENGPANQTEVEFAWHTWSIIEPQHEIPKFGGGRESGNLENLSMRKSGDQNIVG